MWDGTANEHDRSPAIGVPLGNLRCMCSHSLAGTVIAEPYATLLTDGASKGNPGPASIGVILLDSDGTTLAEISERIGTATNNEAEYAALIRGLEEAKVLGLKRLRWRTDSELLQRQWTGQYKVRSPRLIALHREAKSLASELEEFVAEHVRRERNRSADGLANAAFRENRHDTA